MKLATTIAKGIVATDPFILPVTNAVGSAALYTAAFSIQVAQEVTRLRIEATRAAIEKARIAARIAGVPVSVIEKIEATSDNIIRDLHRETEAFKRVRQNVSDMQFREF